MADENKLYPGGPRVFITILVEDAELTGKEIMQNRQVLPGDPLDPMTERHLRHLFDLALTDLLHTRRAALADAGLYDQQA